MCQGKKGLTGVSAAFLVCLSVYACLLLKLMRIVEVGDGDDEEDGESVDEDVESVGEVDDEEDYPSSLIITEDELTETEIKKQKYLAPIFRHISLSHSPP